MPADQIFVGSLTLLLSAAAFAAGLGPWSAPYRLTLAALLSDRWGKPASRFFYVLLGVILLSAGVAIFSGVRPSFAVPQQQRNALTE